MTATMSEDAAGRLRKPRKVIADRSTFDVLANGHANGNGKHVPPATTPPVPIDVPRSIEQVPLHVIRRHPRNRVPTREQIADRARHMGEHGQLEPIIVRPIPPNVKGLRYELVSGETRWQAAYTLKWPTISARVVAMDDRQALMILAAANAQRADLDPIQQAELLAELVKPVADGGAGLSSEEAAAQFGHKADWAETLIRLATLPEPWRGRLASREVDMTKARVLLPFVVAPKVMEAIEEAWDDRYEPLSSMTRETFTETVENIVAAETDALDEQQGYNLPGLPSARHPYYLDFDDPAVAAACGIVELPVRKHVGGNKPRIVIERRITNPENAKKLNEPLVHERAKSKTKRADAKAAKQSSAAKKLTPAQVKAKAKEAEAQLAKRIAHWQHAFKRWWLAEAIFLAKTPSPRWRLELYLATSQGGHLSSAFDAAMAYMLERKPKRGFCGHCDDWKDIRAIDMPANQGNNAGARLIREWLWPTWPDADAYALDDYKVPGDVVNDLCVECGFDMAKAWDEAQSPPDDGGHALVQKFFELHSVEQLIALGKELGVHVPDNAKKSTAVQLFTSQRGRGKSLRLPGCLKERKHRAKATP